MNNVVKFLRWQMRDAVKIWSFWGCMVSVLGLLLGVTFLSNSPIAGWLVVAGLTIIVVDAIRSWFRLSYQIYQNEQRQIEQHLRGKNHD